MTRPSDNVLTWLRRLMKSKGINTAELSERVGLSRSRLRKVLSGEEAMLVDELMQLSEALEVSPADLSGAVDLSDADLPLEDAPTEEAPEPDAGVRLVSLQSGGDGGEADPFGNPVEQLVRYGFDLGCTFMFLAQVDQLDDSGIPEHVLDDHRERGEMLIRLDAKFHRYNQPVFGDVALTLTLSFDQLYDCSFPWGAIRKIVFEIDEDDLPEDPPSRPHLRLVT